MRETLLGVLNAGGGPVVMVVVWAVTLWIVSGDIRESQIRKLAKARRRRELLGRLNREIRRQERVDQMDRALRG